MWPYTGPHEMHHEPDRQSIGMPLFEAHARRLTAPGTSDAFLQYGYFGRIEVA